MTTIAQIGEFAFVHVVVHDDGAVWPLWHTFQVIPSPKVQALMHRAIHGAQEVDHVPG